MNQRFGTYASPEESNPTSSNGYIVGEKYYQYMLDLINAERSTFGVTAVAMGNNAASQLHANACLKSGVVSHWNLEGLKPYMRYSLSKGYHNNGENWYGSQYSSNSVTSNLEKEIDNAMEFLMNSPGHRDTILDPWYRKVNIGLTHDLKNFVAIQHFEGDFIEYHRLPIISDGILRIVGRVKDEVPPTALENCSVDIWYDPPPRRLSEGQLIRVNGYDGGIIACSLHAPLPAGYKRHQDSGSIAVRRFRHPEDFPPTASFPESLEVRQGIMKEAYLGNQEFEESTVWFPFLGANDWHIDGSSFSITADINSVVYKFGAGVYSLFLWAPMGLNGEKVAISHYATFINLPWRYARGSQNNK